MPTSSASSAARCRPRSDFVLHRHKPAAGQWLGQALAATKRVIASAADWDSAEAFARQSEIINPVFGSADAMEGALAFAEKRPPNWRGE